VYSRDSRERVKHSTYHYTLYYGVKLRYVIHIIVIHIHTMLYMRYM